MQARNPEAPGYQEASAVFVVERHRVAPKPRRVAALECGRIAHRAIAGSEGGTVCAVFRRSCYVAFASGALVCLGDRSIGRGPLNARLARFEEARLGDRLTIGVTRARLWRPEQVPGPPLRAALDALRAAACGRTPAQGLGGRIAGLASPLVAHAGAALEALDRWLAGARLDDEFDALLGLGPGLTPSGDDYLGGVLVSLRAFGRAHDADTLWAAVAPQLGARTSRISAAHLAAAAEGEAHESLHACLSALAEGKVSGWRARLDRIASLGHCSGWDGLAGALAVAARVEWNGGNG